ncbi:MAG: hypothetical protein ABI789_12495 [Usitatibacter sp.]
MSLQALEMLAASARVIHHRTHRRNSPAQLFTMGSEKAEAALEASHAMTRHWLAMQEHGALAMWAQWPGLMSSAMRPFRARALSNASRLSRR